MLQEILNIRQTDEEGQRRWFSSNFFDLIVWYDEEKNINGFQLCYDIGRNERALTWQRDAGYSHNKIDDGEGRTYRYKMTPIFIADGVFEYKEVTTKFKEESKKIDAELAVFVYGKLLQFPALKGKS